MRLNGRPLGVSGPFVVVVVVAVDVVSRGALVAVVFNNCRVVYTFSVVNPSEIIAVEGPSKTQLYFNGISI